MKHRMSFTTILPPDAVDVNAQFLDSDVGTLCPVDCCGVQYPGMILGWERAVTKGGELKGVTFIIQYDDGK